jgi:hypothetical protein
VNTITSCSLSSNQISLPAGTYYISASCPAYAVSRNYTRFYNITDSSSAIAGTIQYADAPSIDASTNRSFIEGVITIAGTKTFEVQHYSSATKNGDGFGPSDGGGLDNVQLNIYTIITIEKIG